MQIYVVKLRTESTADCTVRTESTADCAVRTESTADCAVRTDSTADCAVRTDSTADCAVRTDSTADCAVRTDSTADCAVTNKTYSLIHLPSQRTLVVSVSVTCFNGQTLPISPTECIYMFVTNITINYDFFPKYH